MGPLIGPVAGPIAGGFLGEEVGWRWVFWLLLIAAGALALGVEVLNQETYAPVLIRWKKDKMAKELGRTDLRSVYEEDQEPVPISEVLKQGLNRPILLFFKSPIVFLLSTYMVSLEPSECGEVPFANDII
jgi:MFS family permease